jgi:hypothetical protein
MSESADRVPAPIVQVGDEWTFATRLTGGQAALRLHHRVVERAADGSVRVAVRNIDRPDATALAQRLDAQMNRLSREFAPGEAIHYAPAFMMFRFPMGPGVAWEQTVVQTQAPEDPPNRVHISARVVAREAVEVEAGRFDALRIEAEHRAGTITVASTYWYAPRAGRAVRGIEHTEGNGHRSELTYTLLDLRRQG